MSKEAQYEQTLRGLNSFLERRWEREAKAQRKTIAQVREDIIYPWEQESDRIKTTNDKRGTNENKTT